MSRWLKVLPLTLALAALSIFATSCGSGNSQVRFVHAIQDGGPMDIDVNGNVEFVDVAFLGVLPNQPGYTNVPSGSDTIEGLETGTTTPVFTDSIGWAGGAQYTVVATGFSQPGTNGSNVVILSIPDNIPTPPFNTVDFRVIHASPSGAGTVDIYILLNPATGPTGTPQITGLAYEQASAYVEVPFNPNNIENFLGYTVYVTASGSTTPIFSESINPSTAGAVRTLILTDTQNGSSMRPAFLELPDNNND
jgi:hypothetical protein